MTNRIVRSPEAKSLLEAGRIILAHGEVTGHAHEVFAGVAADDEIEIPAADFFEEPDGRRILLVNRPCELRHQEHGPIALDPSNPQQYRQGDVLLDPIGPGAWQVIRQREYSASEIRQVAD
ncbi:MAG TPA: hypothetical protein VEU08_17175 [Vicinamibacterales bacterium]|nr:hypothetical protein [Vicinamibacterales bacterium]